MSHSPENGIPEEYTKPFSEPTDARETEAAKKLADAIFILPLTVDDKVNLILTRAGLKPASNLDIVISTRDEEGKKEHINVQQLEEIMDLIKQSGLPHVIAEKQITDEKSITEDNEEKPYHRERIEVLIARTTQELERLQAALESGSDEQIGQALGFPEGAIQAFLGKKPALDLKSLPEAMLKSDAMLFSSPTLSAENWQEEIEAGQKSSEYIKKISPEIYQEYRKMMLESNLIEKN